ncbi:MAG: T9SS type A sorting domain-containing protein [Saprospiraceae bacterium]|nr:T9SS type A sorting domain-containing protein [Saprospiraceae bacterium]
MRNLLLFCSLFLAFPVFSQTASTSSVQLISEDYKSSTIQVQLNGFVVETVQTPNGEAWTISIENGTPILLAGAPDLPKLTTSLLIDDDAVMDVIVESVSFTDYDNVEIAPSKGNLYRDVDPASVPFVQGEYYDMDMFYPKDIASLREPYIFRDFRGQTLVIQPVQYNPVSKVLRVYDEIILKTIQVAGTPQNAFVRSTSGPILVNDEYDQLYQRRFLNYAQASSRYQQVAEVGGMLIITPSQYMDVLEPFVEWKLQKGIPTEVVDIASIGNNPTAIDAFISDYYDTHNLTFVLLVGDENDIETPETNAGDACDHCYSYQSGNDHYADLFVGRFNGENVSQIQTMVERTMMYEKAPDTSGDDWFSVAAGCASNEGPGDDGEDDFEHLNNVKTQLLDYTYSKVWEFYQGSNGAASPTPGDVTVDGTGNPSTNSVIQRMNEGMSLFNYTGHGNHSSVSTSGFDVDACNQLTNVGKYPFMIVVGCCVGDFTGDYGSGPCLGDAWIRASDNATGEPTGGIAGGFASLLQSWSPPMEGQDEMMNLLAESAVYNIRHTIGGIMIHGFGSMIDEYGNGGIEMADTWNIFGDPSVTLYTAMPQDMMVDHVTSTFVGASTLSVNCNVDGAMIGLYYHGELLATGLVDGGSINFDFDPLNYPEPILVTATAFNRSPYQGEIEVVAAFGPYISLNNYLLDDTAGDQDGKADYGEAILLDVDLSNLGVEIALDVTATLVSTDPNVVITDNTASFGDIEADANSIQNNAYAFTVDPNVQDGHVANFVLEIESAGSSWTGFLNIPLNAPVLSVSPDADLSDQAGGNDNGRIDPGETLVLNIQNLNTGHDDLPAGIGTLSTTSPFVTIINNQAAIVGIDEQGNALVGFEFEVSANVPKLEMLEFVYAVEADIFNADATFNYLMNPIVEDFESNDFESFEWESDGTAPWFTTTFQPYEGDVCSQSGDIANSQSSELVLIADVLEDGDIYFSRKVSSEADWDYLYFYLNGNEMASWSGEAGWAQFSYPVPAGLTVFHWVYEKDNFVSEGADAAWIDEILLPLIDDGTVGIFSIQGDAGDLQLNILPNPVHTAGQIWMRLPESGETLLSIVNMEGQVLQTLLSGTHIAGEQLLEADVSALAKGSYLVVLQQGEHQLVRKLIVQ